MAVAGSMVLGGPVAQTALFGGLCGAYTAIRGAPEARLRDPAFFALAGAAPFLPGPAKVVAGLASLAGAGPHEPWKRAFVGGGLAAAGGLALSLAGVVGTAPLTAFLAAGLAGGLSPLLAPRVAQGVRNLYEDVGEVMRKASGKADEAIEDPSQDTPTKRLFRTLGTVPVSLGGQTVQAFALGSASWQNILLASTIDAVNSGYIMWKSKLEELAPPPDVSTGAQAREQPEPR